MCARSPVTSRATLLWLFGASGPVLGHAHVHVVDKAVFSGTELLVPALLETARVWGAGIAVVHDRQNALAPDRLAALPFPVRFVASGDDPRVQVADFLAGVATRVASDARAGRPDPELAALLAPYLRPSADPLLP